MNRKVGHHISYKPEITEGLTKGEHWLEHKCRCAVCRGIGVNFLRARLNIDPYTYLVDGKTAECGHWVELCNNCWQRVLGIPGLFVERLHKDTWYRARDMYGSRDDRRRFVNEYLRHYQGKGSGEVKMVYRKDEEYYKSLYPVKAIKVKVKENP